MPSNSTESRCAEMKKIARRGKFLGKGAFGEVKDAGNYVIKTEKCKSGFRKRKSDFLPNAKMYMNAIQRVRRAGLAPIILGAYECGDSCVTAMQKAPGETLTKLLNHPEAPQIIEAVYKGMRKLHALLNVRYGHGDLHSSNVLVHKAGNTWKPMFIDFALERKLGRSYDWKFMRESISSNAPKYAELAKQLEQKYAK